MTVHSYFPGYVKIDYHSAYGAHTKIICTREWTNVPIVPGNALGSYQNWATLPCDGEEMVLDLVNAEAEFHLASTIFDIATVYTMDSETSPAIPRASMALGIPGTSVATTWAKAVQQQLILRDTAYNMAKYIMLDVPIGSSWNSQSDISGSPEMLALVGALTSSSWAWSSKANNQIVTFQKVTYKLNDKLRQEYGMD